MADTPEVRLDALGIELPSAPKPAAAYIPTRQSGNVMFTSGQIAMGADGNLVATGHLGAQVDVPGGQQAARQCAINIIAQLKAALGDLTRIDKIVKLTVFVSSTPEFIEQHLVANGASELFGEVFGDAGAHARSAVGVSSLPAGTAVEVEAIVEVS